MSARLRRVDLGGGITTVKEVWLDELTKPEKAEQERQLEVQKYIQKLLEQVAKRDAELEAVRSHARRLGQHAVLLQHRVEEEEHKRARIKEEACKLEREFLELADRWRQETRMLSSDSDIAANFSYHQIIGMGEKALPLIFREMMERGGRWFWALRAITRQNPVKPEDRGKVVKMTQAWLEWGRDHGYV